eukprot:1403301-Amphidinium_carterae.1
MGAWNYSADYAESSLSFTKACAVVVPNGSRIPLEHLASFQCIHHTRSQYPIYRSVSYLENA